MTTPMTTAWTHKVHERLIQCKVNNDILQQCLRVATSGMDMGGAQAAHPG